ncbi:MAG: gliding motility-associated ABC transporter permease subunit GldF [Bacteroidales bacterium]|jgi:ABC-2 type transport system permease protein
MLTLFKREISSFFSSLTGYIVIVVFLLLNGLFIWIFPGEFNILDSGYSTLDPLFIIAPWVFLFLVPAVTMRLFSEEKKTGTLELLMSRPLTDLQVILAKYLAGVVLVVLALIPTLVYYFSVMILGNPPANLDIGAFWGSFIGLIFLAGVYVSVGLLFSALSDNQIVSFILGVAGCFVLFLGFDYFSKLGFQGGLENFIAGFGISFHYNSIARGVVDTRDILYFVSVIAVMILLTKIVLESRKW